MILETMREEKLGCRPSLQWEMAIRQGIPGSFFWIEAFLPQPPLGRGRICACIRAGGQGVMKVFSLCVYVIKEKPLGLGRANEILRRRVEALATKQNALNINMLLSESDR